MAVPFSLLCIFKLLTLVFFMFPITMATTSSIYSNLIHPDIVLNSFRKSNLTLLELVRAEFSSMARYKYLKHRNELKPQTTDIQNSLSPVPPFGFFINFSIGQPPILQYALIDSGSDLLWVPCYPCTSCSSKPKLLYNPTKSSTYSAISCTSKYCRGYKCSPTGTCLYNVPYVDGSFSSGELAKEVLKFSTFDYGTTSISNLVFGCGHDNRGIGVKYGIMGLSANLKSIISQLGSKFSYCTGKLLDRGYRFNFIIIGEEAILEGDWTPMEIHDDEFHLKLEGISVGEKRLNINQNVFKELWSNNKFIIDSGTPFTYLDRRAYNKLVKELHRLIGGELDRIYIPDREDWLCYEGRLSEDLDMFSSVTFHFAEDASFEVDEEGMFIQHDTDTLCLAVLPVEHDELNIFGMLAQQSYNIGYDIQANRLYFDSTECDALRDSTKFG